jgi:hypothetical protein
MWAWAGEQAEAEKNATEIKKQMFLPLVNLWRERPELKDALKGRWKHVNGDEIKHQLHSILSVARLQTSYHQPRIPSISCNLDSYQAVTATINFHDHDIRYSVPPEMLYLRHACAASPYW